MAAMGARRLLSLNGLEKFQQVVVADGMPAMRRMLRSKRQGKLLIDEIHKEIFELGPPTPPWKPTGRSRYLQWLMHHASEISTALDTMRDIEFYIGKFPYRKTRIVKHRHLQFHLEAFLHELYILQERLLQFLKFIERRHMRSAQDVRNRLDEKGDRDPGQPCSQVEAVRHEDRPPECDPALYIDAGDGTGKGLKGVLRGRV
jgi:hypothetical protein